MKIVYYDSIKCVVREKQNSFDHNVAGFIATEDGIYYLLCRDHKNGDYYVVSRENALRFDESKVLKPDEVGCINGNLVRGMTYAEECLDNADQLYALTDIYGNVCATETVNNAYLKWAFGLE